MAAWTDSSRTNRSAISWLGFFSNRANSFSTVWWSFFKRASASMSPPGWSSWSREGQASSSPCRAARRTRSVAECTCSLRMMRPRCVRAPTRASHAHVLLQQHARDARAEVRLALAHGADGREQLGRGEVLGGVTEHPNLERLRDVLLVGEHAEREDALVRLAAQDLARHAHPARQRQRHVEEQDVRLHVVDERVGVLCLARFSHELEIGLRGEQGPHPLPEEAVFIDEGELERHASSAYAVIGNVRYIVRRVMRGST